MSLDAACQHLVGCARATASSSAGFLESRAILARRLVAVSLDLVLSFLVAFVLIELVNRAINARFPNPEIALALQTTRAAFSRNGFLYEATVLLIALWIVQTGFESSRLRATPGKIAVGLTVAHSSGGVMAFVRAQVRFILKLVYVGTPLTVAIATGWVWSTTMYLGERAQGGTAIIALWLMLGLLLVTPVLALVHPRARMLYDLLSGTSVVVRPAPSAVEVVDVAEGEALADEHAVESSTLASRLSLMASGLALAASIVLVIAGGIGLNGATRMQADFEQTVDTNLREAEVFLGGRSPRDLNPDEQRRYREIGTRMTASAAPYQADSFAMTLSSLALSSGVLAVVFSILNLLGRWPAAFLAIWPLAVFFARMYHTTAVWHAGLAAERYGQLQLAHVPLLLDLATAGLVISGLLSIVLVLTSRAHGGRRPTHD